MPFIVKLSHGTAQEVTRQWRRRRGSIHTFCVQIVVEYLLPLLYLSVSLSSVSSPVNASLQVQEEAATVEEEVRSTSKHPQDDLCSLQQ